MKKILLALSLVTIYVVLSCSQTPQPAAAAKDNASIVFNETVHDFGTIPQGSDGSCEFIFKNTGEKPVVLTNVRSSCGCTVPEWPKQPIDKGIEAKIKVTYNTKIVGSFSKKISVYNNGSVAPTVLTIKGSVEAAEN
jgi:hypothetical protein